MLRLKICARVKGRAEKQEDIGKLMNYFWLLVLLVFLIRTAVVFIKDKKVGILKIRRLIKFFMILSILWSILAVLRHVHRNIFVNKMLQYPQIEKVDIMEFTYFPCIIEEYDVKITLKNSNKLAFRNINDSFSDTSILVCINDWLFDFAGSWYGGRTYSSGLPINLLQCVYGKKIKDIKSFLSDYNEICACIYNIESGKIYYDYENNPFAFAGTAMGNKEFLEEINLPFP